MKLRILVLFLLLAGLGVNTDSAASSEFSCATVAEIPQEECQALVALYTGTDGPGWKNSTGWLATDTPCGWSGVLCYGGHVTALSLWGNQLSGAIPPELGGLASL